jgi:hypothetical protein
MILLAQIRPVRIVTSTEGPGPVVWMEAAGAILVAMGIAVLVARWRARRYDPAEAAFRKLARAARLDRRERQMVRELARASGVNKPVALLVSRSAMRAAVERAAAR